jgi:DNA-binding LacI/PurR family transcriptional regulator
MNKRVTRNDVAKLAGVSPAVVSYVINKSKYVSPELTAAVEKAIKDLEYSPNPYARSLKTNETKRIAFVCDNLRNDWIEISEQMFIEKGYTVSHCFSRDGEGFLKSLISQRYDGIFMMSNRYSSGQLNFIANSGIPMVLYQTREYKHELASNIVAVVPDLYLAITKSLNYLALNGHRRILLAPPLRYQVKLSDGIGFREKAYIDAVKANDLVWDPDFICKKTDTMDSLLSEIGDLLLNRIADLRPTAVIAGDDYVGARILQYVKRLGIKVPEDLAVIGMDNTYLGDVTSPTLSSVDFSKVEFGKALSETLIALIQGEKTEDTLLNVSLVIRESS